MPTSHNAGLSELTASLASLLTGIDDRDREIASLRLELAQAQIDNSRLRVAKQGNASATPPEQPLPPPEPPPVGEDPPASETEYLAKEKKQPTHIEHPLATLLEVSQGDEEVDSYTVTTDKAGGAAALRPTESVSLAAQPGVATGALTLQPADYEELIECAICMDTIRSASIGSCAHHYCQVCLLATCAAQAACPKCRVHIKEVRHDVEFDQLLCLLGVSHTDPLPPNSVKLPRTVEVKLTGSCSLGLTLKRNRNGPGVRVARIVEGGQAHKSGLCVDDVIISIGGEPCLEHRAVIAKLSNFPHTQGQVRLVLLPRP